MEGLATSAWVNARTNSSRGNELWKWKAEQRLLIREQPHEQRCQRRDRNARADREQREHDRVFNGHCAALIDDEAVGA